MKKTLLIVDPSILKIVKKGEQSVEKESNRYALLRKGFDPDDTSRPVGSLVILETEEWSHDRRTNAFAILQHSATENGLLLEWTYSTVRSQSQTNYKYEMRVQNKYE